MYHHFQLLPAFLEKLLGKDRIKQKDLKILFITGSLNQGGAEYQILELARLFKEHNHQVEIFAITDYSFYKFFISKHNLQYSNLRNDQNRVLRILLTSKKIKDSRADFIISYLRTPSIVAFLGRILSGSNAKLIVGERTSLILPKKDKFYFFLMRWANHLIVNSVSK